MKHLAIIGPGLMGLGISQVASLAGWRVTLLGRDVAAARAGRDRLARQLARDVEQGRLARAARDEALERVQPAPDDLALAGCELAIEAVAEKREDKRSVLKRLQSALPANALIATNTSGLPVTGLASALDDPGRFLGLHFFSPVPRMKLVEVVKGAATTAETLRKALDFVAVLGRVPVVVRDAPGFFTSRVFAAYLDEALAMVNEGVDPVLVDQVATQDVGRAIGPLALLDDISLALNWRQIQQARADGLPASRCRPAGAPVLEAMVAAGREGRRSGGGFYDVDSAGTRQTWNGLRSLFPAKTSVPPASHIALRLRCAEALEALRCLEEGVIANADDADTASLLGLGYPKDTGGVLSWVEAYELLGVVQACDSLTREHGQRFRPTEWIRELASQGQGLRDFRRCRTVSQVVS